MPCDYRRYPADWPARRARILERAKAGGERPRCEQCGVPNYAVGYRDHLGAFVPISAENAPPSRWLAAFNPAVFDRCGRGEEGLAFARCMVDEAKERGGWGPHKLILIVLTVAHLHDPDPMNCAEDNLAALCQACHNRLDAPMRAAHAAQTRRARKAAADLFS